MWLAAWPVIAARALSNEPAPLYVLWQDRFGFGSATLTLIYAGYIVGLLLALSVGGALADRFGRRPVLVPGLLLGLIASVLFITARSVAVLGAARVLSGIAVGAVLSAGMAAISDLAPQGHKRLGGLIASTAMVSGAAFGPLLTGVLSQLLPYPTVMVFVVQLVLLVVALPLVVRMPLPGPGRREGGEDGPWLRLPSAPRPHRGALLVGLAVFAPALTATGFVLSLGPSLLAQLLHTDNQLLSGGLIAPLFSAATGVQFVVRRLRMTVPDRGSDDGDRDGGADRGGGVPVGAVAARSCRVVRTRPGRLAVRRALHTGNRGVIRATGRGERGTDRGRIPPRRDPSGSGRLPQRRLQPGRGHQRVRHSRRNSDCPRGTDRHALPPGPQADGLTGSTERQPHASAP
ncbi:hypothetical protein GCM10022420_012310 [Streptomyces iranensis]